MPHPDPPVFHPYQFLILSFLCFLVVIQEYEAEADNEYVIRGNSAIMKCEIPSFVADFVFVDSWEDSEGKMYIYNNMSYSGSPTCISMHII